MEGSHSDPGSGVAGYGKHGYINLSSPYLTSLLTLLEGSPLYYVYVKKTCVSKRPGQTLVPGADTGGGRCSRCSDASRSL